MKWIITFLIIATAIYADPVDDLENKYVDVLTKYKVEYDAKCRKLSLAYIKQLEKFQVETVKKGDLDGALKIKAKITEIKKILKTNIPTVVSKNDINNIDALNTRNSIVGIWKTTNSGQQFIFDLRADGSSFWSNTSNALKLSGTWKIKDKILKLAWKNGVQEEYAIKSDSFVGLGNRFTFKKQNSLIGNWQQDHKYKAILQLHANKSAIYNKRNKGTWKVANGILTVTWSHGPVETYKITNSKLTALKTTAVGKLYDYIKIQ